ncbi:hypothetical protein P7C73_g1261, partial [Tremellales sp. Uapishka_1]
MESPRHPLDALLSASQRSSALGKRGATDAGLEIDSTATRKALHAAQYESSNRHRQVLVLEKREAEQAAQIAQQQTEIEKLKNDMIALLDSERREKATGEEREMEWSSERLRMSSELRDLRQQNSLMSSSFSKMEHDHRKLSRDHSSLSESSKKEIYLLSSRIAEVEEERNNLKNWKSRAESLSIDLEEARRRVEEGRQGMERDVAESKTEKVMRDELARQSGHLSLLKQKNSALESEVYEFRQKKKESDSIDRATKETEKRLREEINILQAHLERARREMDSLTQTFPPTSSPNSSDYQYRLSTLSTLHAQTLEELSASQEQARALQERHDHLVRESTSAINTLTRGKEEVDRELRWAKEGRRSSEKREEVLRKEIDILRSSGDGASSASTGDQSTKISKLETLVETYKSELESISRDSREVEERLTHGAGLVKQSALMAAEAKIAQLEKDIESLESTIAQLTSANTTLDAEVSDLMRRVASGEYNPQKERCIEFKNNPASREFAIRQKRLDDLKEENQALLDRLRVVDRSEAVDNNGGAVVGQGLVPRVSFERLEREKEELEKNHAKRLLRLKEVDPALCCSPLACLTFRLQIFGNKSKEFLESVYSLLGWRIKFDESGSDIRLTSMYAPKGKMGLTLKFASQEGHFGTMQMTGAMARGLEECRHFWIVERQSVPGFLAQVTSEMFEKTTIGRAAGYVGLE